MNNKTSRKIKASYTIPISTNVSKVCYGKSVLTDSELLYSISLSLSTLSNHFGMRKKILIYFQ